jgi:hypothetical protein
MIEYVAGATKPDTTITWREGGALVDFSSGFTFEARVFRPGATTSEFTKSSGITGAATDPNVTIAWSTSDLGALAAGDYVLEVRATNGTQRYRRQWTLRITGTAP